MPEYADFSFLCWRDPRSRHWLNQSQRIGLPLDGVWARFHGVIDSESLYETGVAYHDCSRGLLPEQLAQVAPETYVPPATEPDREPQVPPSVLIDHEEEGEVPAPVSPCNLDLDVSRPDTSRRPQWSEGEMWDTTGTIDRDLSAGGPLHAVQRRYMEFSVQRTWVGGFRHPQPRDSRAYPALCEGRTYWRKTVDAQVIGRLVLPGEGRLEQIDFWPSDRNLKEDAITALSQVSPFASGGPSLPVLLAEGLEVKVFWDLAKVSGLAGILAAGWLTYNFAVRPTIQDLGQLMKLPELIASKAKDILRLAKHGSLRKRVKLHLLEETLEGVPVPKGEIVADQIFQGLGNARFFVYNAEVTTVKVLRKRRIWAVVHWRVDAELKQKLRALLNLSYRDSRFNLPALNKLAAGIVTNTAGFGILQTIWEIIPFSWLVDYFVNIQKFLEYVERPDGLDATVWLMRNEQFTVHPDSVVETFEYIPEWKPYNANTIPRPDSKYFEQRVKVLKPGHVEILSRQEWEEDTGVLLRDYLFSPKQWANLTALLGLMRRTKNLPSTPEKQQ